MSETITLQDISGYLPFKLQIAYSENDIRELVYLDTSAVYYTFHFKPLVIPLEEITEEHLSDLAFENIKNLIGYIHNKRIDIEAYQYLLSHHYDVHGWIERGLAVNKNEYLKTIR